MKVCKLSPTVANIVKLSHDARGIARIEGKTTFIQGALPHEKVRFQYIRKKSDYDEAVAVEIEQASPLRVKPSCPHYNSCGGCSLQHVDAPAQITLKQELLIESLQRIGHVKVQEVLSPLIAKHWHYRNKARLSVRQVGKTLLVGYREKNKGRYIAGIEQCAILHQAVGMHVGALKQLISSFSNPSAISQIEVAAGDEQVALIFRHLSPLSSDDKIMLRRFAQEHTFIIYLQAQGPESVALFYPENSPDFLHYTLPTEDLLFQFHPTDFTQVNSELNRQMVAQAMQLMALNSKDIVLDLFCGLGNFSLPLAKRAAYVYGIEGSETMVQRAAMNAAHNHLSNLAFSCANLDEPAALTSMIPLGITKLLLDPPRSGALAVIKQLPLIKPESIVYVSCNPATLARDSGVLVHEQGYLLKKAGVMDMFPHTAHVESIALFERG